MGLFKKKWTNLQPWLNYFRLLQRYEEKGYLEMSVDKGEAYITQAALFTLSGDDQSRRKMAKGVITTARRIRAYAAWQGRHGYEWLKRPFAMHVVKDGMPHDMVFTVLLSRRRRWWKLWMKANVIDVINY